MKGIFIQVLAVLILSLNNFLGAYGMTWISYSATLLESDASPLGIKATKNQINIVTSVLVLGSMTATLTTGHLPELIGRKKTELICGVFCTLAWALVVTATSIIQLIIARFILGFGLGTHLIVLFAYINEICQSFIRGTLASIPMFAFSIGCLVSYGSGWVCSYDVINYLNLSASVLSIVLAYFLKESPVYLISRKEDKEALQSLKFYRGTSKTTLAILEEFEYLKKQRDTTLYTEISNEETPEKTDLNEEKTSNITEMTPWRILMTSKATQRAVFILTSHGVITSLMGALAVQAYAGHFFKAAVPDISSDLCSVILAVAIVIGNSLAIVGADLIGRRLLLVSSCAICTVCLAVLVSLLRWAWAPAWAVPLVMLLYSCAFQAGVNGTPLVQLSESFTPKVKSLASSIFLTCGCTSIFILLSIFSLMVEHLGLQGTFFFFCVVSAISTTWTYLTTKETKGIPLEEIQSKYDRGYWHWS